jgi:hypothetical protein
MAMRQFRFTGLDNQHDPQEVGGEGLVVAANVDIMDDFAVRRREGYTASSLTGTSLHSMWSNAAGSYGFIVDGDALIGLDTSLNQTAVGTLPSVDPVNYCEVNEATVVLSTSATRYVVNNAFVTPTVPTGLDSETEFKALITTLGGGNDLCYFNGRLYVARDDGLHFSDAYNIGTYDTRDYHLPTGFTVQKIASARDGIWVGGSDRIVFLSGMSPKEFQFIDMHDSGVLAMAPTTLDGWLNFTEAAPAHAVLTDSGAYLLADGGKMIDVTNEKYHPPQGSGHSGVVRDINGSKQFLTTFTYSADGGAYTEKTMTADQAEF